MSENDALAERSAEPAPGRPLLDLIERKVRIRFALSAAEFASRLHELTLAAGGAALRPPLEYVRRLCLDDLYLATACTHSDQRAWNELSATHFDFMREFARRFLSHAAARDVADEVIAELWARGRLRQYEGRSTLRTWLGASIAHAALNSRKTASRLMPLDSEPDGAGREQDAAPGGSDAEKEQIAGLLREMLHDAIRGLQPEDRLSLQLYYEQGMTLDEMSVTLHASSAALSRRLKRTREELRAAIEALARRQTGESADALRAGLDLARVELDLGKLLKAESLTDRERHRVV